MSASTSNDTYTITIEELIEMLKQHDPKSRIKTSFGCIDKVARCDNGEVQITHIGK